MKDILLIDNGHASVRRQLRSRGRGLRGRMLPKDLDFSHVTPSYQPWDQRLCTVPDGDLFQANPLAPRRS